MAPKPVKLAPIKARPIPLAPIDIDANIGFLKKPLPPIKNGPETLSPPIKQKETRALSKPLIDPRWGKKALPPMENSAEIEKIDTQPIEHDEDMYVQDLITEIRNREAKSEEKSTRESGRDKVNSKTHSTEIDSLEYRMLVIESAFKTRNHPWKVEEVENLMDLVAEKDREAIKKLWFEHDKHNIANDKLHLFTRILPQEITEQKPKAEIIPESSAQKISSQTTNSTNYSK